MFWRLIILGLLLFLSNEIKAQLDSSFGEDGIFQSRFKTQEIYPPHFVIDDSGFMYTYGLNEHNQLFLYKVDEEGKQTGIGKRNFEILSLGAVLDVQLRDIALVNNKLYILYNKFKDERGTRVYDGYINAYGTDLQIDTSFGLNGRVEITGDSNNDIFVESIYSFRGGLLVAGGINIRTDTSRLGMVTKFNLKGDKDFSFGIDGSINYTIGNDETAQELFPINNGFLLIKNDEKSFTSYITKYNNLGEVDVNFASQNNGTFIYSVSNFNTPVFQSAIQEENGDIVVAGQLKLSSTSYNTLLIKLDSFGNYKPSFGNNGNLEIDNFNSLNLETVTNLYSTDTGYLIGLNGSNGNRYLAALMLHKDGTIDTDFSHNGLLIDKNHNSAELKLDMIGRLVFLGISKTNNYLYAKYLQITVNKVSNITEVMEPFSVLYPNPTAGAFDIVSEEAIKKCILVDQNGVEIFVKKLPNPKRKIELDLSLPNGIFLLRVYNSKDMMQVLKVMVQR